jgi:hypothetical protein
VVGAGSLDLRWEQEKQLEEIYAAEERKQKKSSDEDTTEQQ